MHERGPLADTYSPHPMLESIFSIASTLVLPAWLALAIAPTHRWTQRIAAWVVPALLAVAYVGLLVISLRQPDAAGGFGSLEDVATLFESRHALLGGWIHYLAFDLIIGAWEARDADRIGLPRWVLIPCLGLTFMAGPAGWLLYGIARMIRLRKNRDV
ncbi:MAG: ABA4-like family protein [Rubricoccaceae bacterium]